MRPFKVLVGAVFFMVICCMCLMCMRKNPGAHTNKRLWNIQLKVI